GGWGGRGWGGGRDRGGGEGRQGRRERCGHRRSGRLPDRVGNWPRTRFAEGDQTRTRTRAPALLREAVGKAFSLRPVRCSPASPAARETAGEDLGASDEAQERGRALGSPCGTSLDITVGREQFRPSYAEYPPLDPRVSRVVSLGIRLGCW